MPVYAVDIETQTKIHPDYPEVIHRVTKDFGLSVLSPITDIAIYEKNKEPIVLDMRAWDPWLQTTGDFGQWQMLRDMLCQPDVIIVGHNVVFDLRHIIAHYNFWHQDTKQRFHLPLGVKVWDTLTIAKRMLLGEQMSDRNKGSGFGDSFALAGGLDKNGDPYYGMSERFGLLDASSDFWKFYTWMKTQRNNLSNLASTLQSLSEEHAVWTFLGGWIPPNRPDLLDTAATTLLREYVSRDAILAYDLYEYQQQVAQQLATEDYHHGHIYIPKWPELTQRDIHNDFTSLLDFWTRRLRLNANRAGKGLLVNLAYVQEQKEKASQLVKTRADDVLSKPDKHDPYLNFERVFGMILYYKMVLDCIHKNGTFSKTDLWAFWEPIKIAPAVLADALSDVPGKQQWLDWLLNTKFQSKKQIISEAPGKQAPQLDIIDWVRRNCYIGYEEPLASYLASVKTNWLSYFYKTKMASLRDKARQHLTKIGKPLGDDDSQLELGMKLYRKNYINSRIWIPFYIHCVANTPLATSEEFKYAEELTTKKFKQALTAYRRSHDNQEPPDFKVFAIATNTLSYGKNTLNYYLQSDHYDAPDLAPLRELMQAKADLQKFKEFEVHAALDGALHSIIINDTKSGRASSNNPNLQNIKMSSKQWEPPTPFPGTFKAPDGMWLTEWDYSNAEVRMGNMIGGDNAAAAATEGFDRHAALAEIYSGSTVWSALTADERKKKRNEYKRVTFAREYGAGAYRIALQIKTTIDRAQEIINNTKRAFYKIEEQKKIVTDNARKRQSAGCVPVYVGLWDRSRGQVDRTRYGNKIDCAAYTGWNTLQQGGVTAMISRADVLISEMLEREHYQTFVQQDVHDSLIIAFDINEFYADNFALPVRIAQIMGSIMPDEYCERTSPKTHFVTALGPENAKKWGYNPHLPYPLPTDTFINQWGAFKLPEGKDEAPTWIGNEAEGWTLESETQAITLRKKMLAEIEKTSDNIGSIAASDGAMWVDLQLLLATLPQQDEFTLRLQQPLKLVSMNSQQQLIDHGHFTFAGWMTAGSVLYHKGQGKLYSDMLCKIKNLVEQHPEHFQEWSQKYAINSL